MTWEEKAEDRARLAAELALRQRHFVDAATAIHALVHNPARDLGGLILARLRLGQTIRRRRSLIGEILALPASGAIAEAAAADVRAATARLQDRAVPWLGFWTAARIVADPERLAATLTPIFEDVMAITHEEVAATGRYLDALAFPLPPRAAFG